MKLTTKMGWSANLAKLSGLERKQDTVKSRFESGLSHNEESDMSTNANKIMTSAFDPEPPRAFYIN